MKKIYKIIFIILAIVILFVGFYAYKLYKVIAGSEELAGKVESIPREVMLDSLSNSGSADWPNWRGPNFDGKSNISDIDNDWSDGLVKLWQIDYLCQGQQTASWAAPTVKGQHLIVPGRDDTHDLIFCINTENGELIWKASYEAPAQNNHGPGARATPFIDDDRVYTFGRSGDLLCLKLENGKILWKLNVTNFGGLEPDWGFSSTPLVYKDKVIVQGGGTSTAIAFDKITGEMIWKSMDYPAGYSFSMPIRIGDKTRILIYHGLGLACLDPDDGKKLWNVPWETDYGVNATTPLVDENYIFHTSNYGKGGQLIKASEDKAEIIWKNDAIAAHHSDPILIDGYIYGYSGESFRNKGEFKCVDFKTGKEMWSTSELNQGTTTFVDGYLICMDLKGNLFLVEPNPKEFKKIGEIEAAVESVRNPSWTVPVVANSKLYLRYLQRLVCYQLVLDNN